jgi:hypothetical protein
MTTNPPKRSKEAKVSIRQVERLSWSLLAAMTIAGRLCFDDVVALSIFVGGTIVNISFWLLKRDLVKVLRGPLTGAKAHFLLKYYARLSVLAVILYFLLKHVPLDLFALLVGLSTTMLSIVITVVAKAKKILGNAKEAS